MSNDDVLFRFRLRVIALARELGSVREACRMMEVHPSSYYRWRKLLERYGPDMLRPRERRRPQMPNAISHQVEQKVLAFALAHPSFGPHRIALELKHERWGVSPSPATGSGGCSAVTASNAAGCAWPWSPE